MSLADAAATAKLPTQEGKPRTMAEITVITGQLESLCYAAEDVIGDDGIKLEDRIQKWQDSFEDEEITSPDVLEMAGRAAEKAGTPEAYVDLRKQVDAVLKNDWECEALGTLLGPADGAAKAEGGDVDGEEGESGAKPPEPEPDGDPAKAADGSGGDPE